MLLFPIFLFSVFLSHGPSLSHSSNSTASLSSSLFLSPHPDPESVVLHLHRRVEESLRRAALSVDFSSCLTGNPIDDCWLCDVDWEKNRQRLADCGVGFGGAAAGGKGGAFYLVVDSSDDPVNPKPGTLRYAVIQSTPLWIIFYADMTIILNDELMINSFKTIDGRGAAVHVTGRGCITIQHVSNIIIHNVHVSRCVPTKESLVRSTPERVGWRGRSDGDGISIYNSRMIWIDHVALSRCTDGLIDAIMGSTGITISNSYFSHHDEVMLLGHRDDYVADSGMQVTIAFNRFGEGLVQRMPRCRRGYFHIVNNDFREWEMYAIGGSAGPTINSQGNRFIAPFNPNAKEVTKRVDTEEMIWSTWNWRTEGDIMVNGAYFVPSGEDLWTKYAKASSLDPKSAATIDQLTMNAGVLGGRPTVTGEDAGSSTGAAAAGDGGGGGADSGFFGMIFGSGAGISGGATQHSAVSLFSLSLSVIVFFLAERQKLGQ